MATAPQTPESPDNGIEEVPVHFLPRASVTETFGPDQAQEWLEEKAPHYFEILGLIAAAEGVTSDLRAAGPFFAQDLSEMTHACSRSLVTGCFFRLVDASEWVRGPDCPDHLRSLAALAASAPELIEDDLRPAREAYHELGLELERRMRDVFDRPEYRAPVPTLPTPEEFGERAIARHLRAVIRACDPATRELVADLSPEELARRLQRDPSDGSDDAA